MSNANQQQTIIKLKKRRGVKKGSITRRINEIVKLINEQGSRTKVKSLLRFLLVVKQEVEDIEQELADLDENHDESWIEAERERFDTVQADVDEYLTSRADDPPSTVSLTESWIHHNAPGIDNTSSLDDDVNRLAEDKPSSETVYQHDVENQLNVTNRVLPNKYPQRPPQHQYQYPPEMSATVPEYVSMYTPPSPHHTANPSSKPKVYFVDRL